MYIGAFDGFYMPLGLHPGAVASLHELLPDLLATIRVQNDSFLDFTTTRGLARLTALREPRAELGMQCVECPRCQPGQGVWAIGSGSLVCEGSAPGPRAPAPSDARQEPRAVPPVGCKRDRRR
jgi:hypothetical protein